jgi:hypothetical protein
MERAVISKYLLEAEARLQQPAQQRRAFAIQAAEQARTLYRNKRADAALVWLWKVITRRPTQLRSLAGLADYVRDRHTIGMQTIPLAQVLGTEGREGDFDSGFRPMQEHTRDRWVSVATAMIQGLAIPPIEVIQVADRYFVRDGHHRVSVARALGQTYIEANVTVWRVAAPAVAELASATSAA